VEAVAESLKSEMRGDARIHVHRRDGYEAHALLPPVEKRGLVLIDPPFERPDEFDAVADFIQQAQGRFGAGIFAAWYPLKNRHAGGRFVRRVARESSKPVSEFRFETGAPGEGQMRACGVLVVNPPFRFEEEVMPALRRLVPLLSQGKGAAVELESFGTR
jgi:23S rRNA (adenine2030-N6)-methyltransferase